MESSNLPALPTELLSAITSLLPPASLLDLRRVNKTLSEATFPLFLSSFFRTLDTDLSAHDLLILRGIAANPSFAAAVQVLRIRGRSHLPGHYGISEPAWRHLRPLAHSDSPAFDTRTILRELLMSMPNCCGFYVRSLTGRDEFYNSQPCLMPTDLVAIALSVFSELSRPLDSFAIAFGTGENGRASVQMERQLEKLQLLLAKAWSQRLLCRLQDLMLHLELTTLAMARWAMDFVLRCPALRKLDLSFGLEGSVMFFDVLSKTTGALPSLAEFKISGAMITEHEFLSFLCNSRATLKLLTILSTRLETGTWRSVFAHLRLHFTSLQEIRFYRLSHSHGDLHSIGIVFPNLLSDPSVPESGGRRFEVRTKTWTSELQAIGAAFESIGVDETNTRGKGMRQALEMLEAGTATG